MIIVLRKSTRFLRTTSTYNEHNLLVLFAITDSDCILWSSRLRYNLFRRFQTLTGKNGYISPITNFLETFFSFFLGIFSNSNQKIVRVSKKKKMRERCPNTFVCILQLWSSFRTIALLRKKDECFELIAKLNHCLRNFVYYFIINIKM